MHTQGPAALLDKHNEMEGRVSARLRLAIPKPGEDEVRVLGEGGTWWEVGHHSQGWWRDRFPCS